MSAPKVIKESVKHVKPLLSVDKGEARKRVINLYKAWYRQIPYIVLDNDLVKNTVQCRQKLREEFDKQKNIKDIRVIDMLVIKGQMELKECVKGWKQKSHIMSYWKDTHEPKPQDFLSKFVAGTD